jgi:3-oxoacyl-[acyl-carrier protein] reductase
MRLAGKVAIVTGGGSGFGEGIAKRFAEEGARVVVNDIDERGGARVTAEIEKAQGQGSALFARADVAVNADVARLVRATLERYSKLDIIVNNAGITHVNGPMLEVSEALFDRVFAVNVKSIYLAALHVVPVFRKQGGGGCIINTASTAGLRPRPGLVWYNGSKGAAITLTKAMAVELAPDKIRVNALCPVAGDTPLLASFMGGDTPENRKKFIASIPLGRLSQPRDIANAALYLASDEADFITGVALEVDGGRCV